MTLNQIINRLASVELANLGLVDPKTYTVKEGQLPKIVFCIQSALTTLYTKFFIKESDLILVLIDGKTEYELSSKHNVDDQLNSDYDHYIYKGFEESFQDDIIKITSVCINTGEPLPINKPSDPTSVFLPRYNLLQVPYPFEDAELAITYQADHPKLDPEDLDKELEIPDSYLLALLTYTSYLLASSIHSPASINYSEMLLAKFNSLVQELEFTSMDNHSNVSDDYRFINNGWC